MAPSEEPRAATPPPEGRHETETRATTPTPTPTSPPAKADPGGDPGFKVLGLSALLALACGMGGAYAYEHFLADHPAVVRGPAVAAEPEPAAPAAETKGSPDSPRVLTDKLATLSQEVDALKKQVGSQAKPVVAPEIASLQVRVADLTESTDALAPVPSKVDHLNNRVNELAGTLSEVRNDLTALQSRAGSWTRLASTPRERPAPTPAPAPAPETESHPRPDAARDGASKLADPEALAHAADLFKHGKYKASLDACDALEAKDPDDARVWYYAALSHGFSTGDWNDGAARLVEKGLAREEAGTPEADAIDTEFRDLTSANGKDWLAAYRKRVKAH